MLAEAAHSAADSVNEVFLAFGLHLERAPADETHPGGHGRERFLWGVHGGYLVVSYWRLPVHRLGRCTVQGTTRCVWQSCGMDRSCDLVRSGRSVLATKH